MAIIRGSKGDDSGTKSLNGAGSADEVYGFAGNGCICPKGALPLSVVKE